eukprot:9699394-Alexandrium_andersonii.AAC.1
MACQAKLSSGKHARSLQAAEHVGSNSTSKAARYATQSAWILLKVYVKGTRLHSYGRYGACSATKATIGHVH